MQGRKVRGSYELSHLLFALRFTKMQRLQGTAAAAAHICFLNWCGWFTERCLGVSAESDNCWNPHLCPPQQRSSPLASLALDPPHSQASTSGCQPLARPLLVRMLGRAVSRLLALMVRVMSTPEKLARLAKETTSRFKRRKLPMGEAKLPNCSDPWVL